MSEGGRAGPGTGVIDVRVPPSAAGAQSDHSDVDATGETPTVVQRRFRSLAMPRRAGGLRGWIGPILVTWAAVFAGFVLFVVFISAFPESRAQSGLQRHFAVLLANGQAPIGGTIPAGAPVARIDIPSVGVYQIVVEGTTADQLRNGPGHLPASPMPGQPGNCVIVAHALAYGGPFGSIGSLRVGALVKLLTGQGVAMYRVTAKVTVGSSDSQPFLASKDNQLSLITASGAWASSRLVVTARLVSQPQQAPAGQPTQVLSSQAGLEGGGGVGPALGLWLEVFLAVAGLTVLAYRRLPRWTSYVITTPVLLAALWLLYTTLARLLPAAL